MSWKTRNAKALASELFPSAELKEWDRDRPAALIKVGERLAEVDVTILTRGCLLTRDCSPETGTEAKRFVALVVPLGRSPVEFQ